MGQKAEMRELAAAIPAEIMAQSLRDARAEFERAFLTRIFEEEGFVKAKVARRVGMSWQGLEARLNVLGMKVERKAGLA